MVMKNKNGQLNVVKRNGNNLICRCDCGKIIKTTKSKFYKAKSCGCLRIQALKSRSKIQESDKFGYLQAVKSLGKDSNGNSRWECLCFCGTKIIVRSTNLLSGKSKSCGCVSSAIRNESYYANHPELAKKYIK
jgi:hypothetical protein